MSNVPDPMQVLDAPQYGEPVQLEGLRSARTTSARTTSMQEQIAEEDAIRRQQAFKARQVYDGLGENSDFAELDYENQLQVRRSLVNTFLPHEEGFDELEEPVQNIVARDLIHATPAFKDENIAGIAKEITRRVRENPEDPGVADFVTHSHLSNTLLQGNLQRWIREDPNTSTFDFLNEDHNDVDDALTGSESDKLRNHITALGQAYNSEAIQTRETTANIRSTVENVGLLAAFTVGTAKIIGPMYAAHRALGQSIGGAVSPTVGKFVGWNLPKITTSAAGSAGWLAANEARNQLAPRGERLITDDSRESWDNVADAFGESFKFSLMMSYAFGAAGIALKGVKGVSHLWRGQRGAQLSAAEVKAVKRGLATPSLQVDESQLARLPVEEAFVARAKIEGEQIIANRQLMKNIRNHPEELTKLFAPNADTWINNTEVGGRKAWQLMREVAPNKEGIPQFEWETITDLTALKKRVGELTMDKYRSILKSGGKEVADNYLATNTVAAKWGRTANAIDNTMDARFSMSEAPDDIRKATENYISMVDRPVVNPSEFDNIKRTVADLHAEFGERSAQRLHQFDLTEEGLKAARESGTILLREGSSNGNAFAVAVREATPEQTTTIQKLAAKIMQNTDIDEVTARRLAAMDDGFDALRHADGTVEYFYPEKIKLLSSSVDPTTGRVGGVAATRAVPETLEDAFTTTQHVARAGIRADIPLGPATADADLMATAATTIKGNLGDEAINTVRSISRGYLQQNNVDLTNVKVKLSRFANRIDDAGTVAKVSRTADGLEVTLPKSISRQDAQQKMVRELFDGLDSAVGKKSAKKAMSFGQQVERAYAQQSARFAIPMNNPQAKKKWVESIIENRADGTMTMNADGTVRVKLPGVKAANFSSLDEAYSRVMDRSWTVEHLRADLARKGIKLTQSKDGLLRATSPQWSEPVEAKSVVKMMDNLNYRPERLDASYAPRVVEITPENVAVQFDGFSYKTAGKQDALQMLGRFEDTSYLARQTGMRSIKNATVSRNNINEIDISMPEMSSRLTFKNQDEALTWLRNEADTIDGFRRIAHNKGLDLTYNNGAWNVSDGRQLHKAHDIPGLKRIFKQYPDPQAAPDVFAELDPQLVRQLDSLYNSGQIKVSARTLPSSGSGTFYEFEKLEPNAPLNIGPLKRIGQTIQKKIETFDYVMESQVRPEHPQLYKYYRAVEHGRRTSINAHNQIINRHLEPAMRTADGHLMKNKQFEKITHFIEAQTEEQLEAFARNHGTLTTDEQGFVNAMRATFGTQTSDGITTGLAYRFGITPEKFIGHYMPRIRNYLQQAPAREVNSMVTADQLLDRVFQGNQKTISQIKPFFENMRVQEVSTMARDMNAASLLMKYSSLGHKKMFMNSAWRGMSNYMRTNKKALDSSMVTRINLYRDQIIGTHRPVGYETVADIGENFWAALGSSNPVAGRQLFEKGMSLNYLTNMAFRPYLAIRNTFQPFTTLAPRFGNANVLKAYQQVGELGEDYYQYLRSIGLITDTPPIVNMTHDMNSLMGRVLKRGLEMYKRSDDITRAVSFRTGENLIDDALTAMRNGKITTRAQLRQAIGLQKINPTTADEIMFHLDQATPEGTRAAKNIFGTLLSEETMFAYRPEQMPEIHSRHIIGKMFGQYGTYSAGYRANLYRGLQYGSAADRAAFVTRFVGNQMALYGSFSAAGITAYNFLPGAPALFSGGPNFQLATDAVEGLGTGWQGAEARNRIARSYSPITGQGLNVPRQLPVARHIQWVLDAHKYAEEGDNWRSFLSLTMTPVRRE